VCNLISLLGLRNVIEQFSMAATPVAAEPSMNSIAACTPLRRSDCADAQMSCQWWSAVMEKVSGYAP